MANPFYQRSEKQTSSAPALEDSGPTRPSGGPPHTLLRRASGLKRGFMSRLLSAVSQAYYDARSCGADVLTSGRRRRGRNPCRESNGHQERDVLWRAKCNAFRRALLDHGLTEAQACQVLVCLSTPEGRGPGRGRNRGSGRGRDRGCELASLGSLTSLSTDVLDRVVPLMGLQSFITVEERDVCGRPGATTLFVRATEHGLRYVGEAEPRIPRRAAPTDNQAGHWATGTWRVDV